MTIAILGYSGSGKSTLAKELAERYQLPKLYLDTVNFTANWQERDRAEAATMVSKFMLQPSWVIDGNYSGFCQAERLEQADRIILLLFSRWVCLARALRRHCEHRNRARESMSAGCNEKMDIEFIWWILHEGRNKARRDQYQAIARRYPDKTIIIRNQRELDRLLRETFTAKPKEVLHP